MQQKGFDYFVITSPESIAWLLNLRGGDLEYTPIVFCRMIIEKNNRVKLFIDLRKVNAKTRKKLNKELNIKIPFLHIAETMKHIPEDVVDKVNVPIMIVGAEKDCVNPIEETQFLFDKAKEPKELLIISKATHYEVYSGHYFEEVIEKELDFFDKNL